MNTADREALQNKMINEEYKIWKKNSVFLYDIMYRFVEVGRSCSKAELTSTQSRLRMAHTHHSMAT